MINVDAIIFVAKHAFGIRVLIRNWNLAFMVAKATKAYGSMDAHRGEFLDAQEGLIFVWELGFMNIYLEGGAKYAFYSIVLLIKIFP